MTTTEPETLEEARQVLEKVEYDPYRPQRAAIADYHANLLRDNRHASPAEIYVALQRWIDDQTARRRAQVETAAAMTERAGRQTACKLCEKPGQSLAYVGVTELERRQGAKYGFVDYFCERCRFVVGVEWAQMLAAETVDDQTRSELARKYLAEKV